ncbi:ATP-dependent DNA ligase clustered with Ku protein, LigD [plant metagenome]|uniref:DNA ligase (ATP) n=1 Tax=plant metagenome TaxID=1297885 RepID=A0A484SCH6_9ZZZZ
MADTLKAYRAKRDFTLTAEPADGGQANPDARAFVIQKHWASRLHYDLRLELDGAMKSWAVPKGPSYDPSVKRMAVQVEDHPIAYNQFEGDIPKGQYGAGKVIIWDEGTWAPVGDPRAGYRKGHLKFALHGRKMQGGWALVRMKGKDEKQPPWLLIKEKDALARAEDDFSVVEAFPDSVVPLRQAAGSGALPGVAADLPGALSPQLATLADAVPGSRSEWLYEIKFDGYRILARVEGEDVRLYTRNGHDWTARMPRLAKTLARLDARSAWIDGEVVVLAENGAPSFQALQNAFDSERTADIVFYAFDLPYLGGRDLRGEPLSVRRHWLEKLMARSRDDHLRFSEAFDAAPSQLAATACKMGLEGIIAKRQSSRYVSRRSPDWLKIKCARRQEFVVVGYTAPKGGRSGFGALLLAVHDAQGGLRYAGRVGSGFDAAGLARMKQQLDALRAKAPPLQGPTGAGGGITWVAPQLVVEVSFGEWTSSGHVRQAVFRGVREDKPAQSIMKEAPMTAKRAKAAAKKTVPARRRTRGAAPEGEAKLGKLTHPERVIDPSTGLTKLDLARYYAQVATLILPQLKNRPVSFLRAPQGIHEEQFFQKHKEARIPGVRDLPRSLDPDHAPLMEVSTPQALLSAVQMNVVEFHTWNAGKTVIGKPDRLLFDLDPGKGVAWLAVKEGAALLRSLLEEIGLRAWLKTSGGKGLHVVVPLRRQYEWGTVKDFSAEIVRHLARTIPQRFVAKSGPRNREGKIFVDYLRNGFGATTVAAWSARARPGLGVSVPIRWDELDSLESSAQWTIADIAARLEVGNAPWSDYAPQAIGRAMKAMGMA